MLRNEGERLRRVIVSAPKKEYFLVEHLKAHNIGEVADRAKATQQHRALRDLLRKSGCRVVNVPELAGHPNSVFARDAGLVTPRGYIKLRMGLKTRRGEDERMAGVLDSLGVPSAGEIKPPGTVEGGDVILAGEVAFVGRSERTNASGVKQLTRLLGAMAIEVRVVLLTPPHLHIGGPLSVIGPRAVLCCRSLFPREFFDGFKKVEVSPSYFVSGNVICLGGGEVIVELKNRGAAKALSEAGYKVHSLDLSEFVKGRGGPTCLILPVDRG